jgi:aspartate-semialdehyde dehydrogenase
LARYQIMKIAVVGATGLVGRKMIQVLEERNIPITELIPVASERSLGTTIQYRGNSYTVVAPEKAISMNCTVALFSAGSGISQIWAPKFAEAGCFVIDNSSCWRMKEDVPLVVPEINADTLNMDTKIIANPNCSTIQMVMALYPIHKKFGIKRIIVSTYQSVSGTGAKAIRQLEAERRNEDVQKVYPYDIDLNLLPHIDSFTENGFTKEEMKMINETQKIMRAPHVAVTATTVRVPVKYGHSESVYFELSEPARTKDILQIWHTSDGISVLDNPAENIYPMPKYCEDRDEVFVGRLRADLYVPNAFNCWIVSDNLRKGAATNAVQILQYLINHNFILPKA